MPEYRQRVREYILASKKLLVLGDHSTEETEAITSATVRLLVLLELPDNESVFLRNGLGVRCD